MNYIKIFGLPRSGTNFTKFLINKNTIDTEVVDNYPSNKHSLACYDEMLSIAKLDLSHNLRNKFLNLLEEKSLPIVICTKGFCSWVASYYRLQKKKYIYRNPGEDYPFDLKFATKFSNVWLDSVLYWDDFSKKHSTTTLMISHQDLIVNPAETLHKIIVKFNLKGVSDDFILKVENQMKRGTGVEQGEELIEKESFFSHQYHIKSCWRKEVPPDVFTYLLKEENIIKKSHPHLNKYLQEELYRPHSPRWLRYDLMRKAQGLNVWL